MEQLSQGETRRRGRGFQDRAMLATSVGGTISTRQTVEDDAGGTALRQGEQSNVEQLTPGELRRRVGDLLDQPMQADNIIGNVSTRKDVTGPARRQAAQLPVEQLRQGELRGLGADNQDWATRAGNYSGIVSTRRETSGDGDVGGAAQRQSSVEQIGPAITEALGAEGKITKRRSDAAKARRNEKRRQSQQRIEKAGVKP